MYLLDPSIVLLACYALLFGVSKKVCRTMAASHGVNLSSMKEFMY